MFTVLSIVTASIALSIVTSPIPQDIIENEEIKLDWTFKVSLITDLVNVSNHLCLLHPSTMLQCNVQSGPGNGPGQSNHLCLLHPSIMLQCNVQSEPGNGPGQCE